MKTGLLLICVLIFSTPLFTQTLQWSAVIMGATPRKMVQDANENLYIAGSIDYFSPTYAPDFDPDTAKSHIVYRRSAATNDAFLVKYNKKGEFQWVQTLGSVNGGQAVMDIDLDPFGNIHIVGGFSDSLFYGNNYSSFLTVPPNSTGGVNGYWATYSPAGSLIWIGQLNDTSYSYILTIDIKPNGDFVLGGYYRGEMHLKHDTTSTYMLHDPDMSNTSQSNSSFIACFSQSKSLKWAYAQSEGGDINSYRTLIDLPNDAVMISGGFEDTVDIDPTSGVFSLMAPGNSYAFPYTSDTYILRLDSTGGFMDAKILDGQGQTLINFKKNTNSLFFYGPCTNSTDLKLDTSILFIQGGMYIARYDYQLSYKDHVFGQNTSSVGGIQDLYDLPNGQKILVVKANGVQRMDLLNNSAPYSADHDIFVNRYNADYSRFGVIQFKDPGNEMFKSSAIGSDSSYYILMDPAGSNGFTDIEPGPDTILVWDYSSFVLAKYKFGPMEDTNISVTICPGDSIKIGSLYYSSAGTYIDTFFTSLGGDSLVYTQLILDVADTTSLNVFLCDGDSLMIGGSWVKTTGTYYDTTSNHLGCDSILEKHVQILATPVLDLGPDIKACDGEVVTINAYNSAFTSYLWSDNQTDSALTYTYMEGQSNNTLWLKVSNSIGCFSTDTLQVLSNNLGPSIFIVIKPSQIVADFKMIALHQNVDQWTWKFGDGNSHIGDTVVSHTYAASGSYLSCLVTENECGIDSNCQTVGVFIGVDEISIDDQLSIYPNPVHSLLTLSLAGTDGKINNVRIFNGLGQEVSQKDGNGSYTQTLDVSDLKPSVYLLELTTDKRKVFKLHFVKE